MFIPVPVLLLCALAFLCLSALLWIAERQIREMDAHFWQLSKLARESQKDAASALLRVKYYQDLTDQLREDVRQLSADVREWAGSRYPKN